MNKEQVITDERIKGLIKHVFMEAQKGGGYTNETGDHFLHWFHQPPQQEWEVVEYECRGRRYILNDEGDYKCGSCSFTPDSFVNDTIKKVRRKSDSAVLEVGKEYEIDGRKVTVTSFDTESSSEMIVWLKEGNENKWEYLKTKISIKECTPVFNWVVFTEVGFGFTTWEEVYWEKEKAYSWNESVKMFETPHEAKEFIQTHNPNLSLAVIREAFKEVYGHNDPVNDIMKVIESGLSRLKTKDHA